MIHLHGDLGLDLFFDLLPLVRLQFPSEARILCCWLVDSFSHEFRRSFQRAIDPVLSRSVLHSGFSLELGNLARNPLACKGYLVFYCVCGLRHSPL